MVRSEGARTRKPVRRRREEGGGRRASDGLVAGEMAMACGGFDQLMTPPAAPVVTTSVPARVRPVHEAW